MGNATNKRPAYLEEAVYRSQSRAGRIAVTGRYHLLPKTLKDDYELDDKVLGTGYNGQVFLARRRGTDKKFAVKGFKLLGASEQRKLELATECEIFLAMDHPHIALLVDVYEEPGQLHLVMECLTGGEVFHRVAKRKRYSEHDALDTIHQMLLAVNYIHSHDVVHRDLKLENFLYDSEDSDILKLIDFGFSKIVSPNTRMAVSCGSLAYCAPEVLNRNYTSQCDLWSMGVISFILLSGYMPFYGSFQKQIENIKTGNILWKPEKWKAVSKEAEEFVKQLLTMDPTKRLTAQQALEHSFLKDRTKSTNDVDSSTLEALCSFGQASAFRKACLNVMAWSLSNEERASVRDAFLALDVDKTGVIRLWELKQVLEGRVKISNEQIVEVFRALDQNHQDEINYSEFLAAMCTSKIHMHDDLLKQTFHRFDTDNSGVITIENLKEVFGEGYDGEKIEAMLAEADFSQDGKISFQEFMAYMRMEDVPYEQLDVVTSVLDCNSPTRTEGKNSCPQPFAAKEYGLNKVLFIVDDEGNAPRASSDCICTLQ